MTINFPRIARTTLSRIHPHTPDSQVKMATALILSFVHRHTGELWTMPIDRDACLEALTNLGKEKP